MDKTLGVKDYLEIIVRRKWFFIIPFVVIIMMVGAYAKWTPRIYQASTLILLEQGELTPDYVRPMVTESREDRFKTIMQQITSTHFIEKIIEEFNLLAELKKRPPLESVVRDLRKRISVKVTGEPVTVAFSISFEDRNPVMAMKIANRLTTLLIERTQQEKQDNALETINFLDKELGRVQMLLAQQERKMSEFRTSHLGVLPEDLAPRGRENASAVITDSDDLVVLYSVLRRLRLKYTDEHPEIVSLKARIAEAERKNSTIGVTAKLEAQSTRSNADITLVEQQVRELSRNYQVTQNEYQSLLDKRIQAALAARMEQKQTGHRFQILDQAKVPEEPFKPNVDNLLLIGLLLAMGAGVGLVAVTERLDTSFYKIEDLEEFAELPVIANIFKVTEKKTFYTILKKFTELPVIASISKMRIVSLIASISKMTARKERRN